MTTHRKATPIALGLLLSFMVAAAPSCGPVDHDYCRAPRGLQCPNIPELCSKQQGCSLMPGCISVDCPRIGEQGVCEGTQTCRWREGKCEYWKGTICDGLVENDCALRAGCEWATACVGMRKTCTGLDEAECRSLSHCTWERVPDF